MRRALLAAFAAILVWVPAANASIYVKPTGDDATCTEGSNLTACATPAKALSLVTAGQTVYCLPGSYPATTVTRAFTRPTRLNGGSCNLAGLTTSKTAENLTVTGVDVAGNTNLAGSNIVLSGTNHTNPGGTCVRIRGAHNATVTAATVHDCKRGIDSPYTGNSTPATASDDSTGVTIQYTTITGMAEDGIAIGDWTDVLIADNTLSHLEDPCRADPPCATGHPYHNDGIQFFGAVHDVRVLRNSITDSGSQGMLLQTAGGNIPNTAVDVENNTVTNIAGVALQADASGALTFAGNTLCGKLGSLWVWDKTAGATVAVTDNTLSAGWSHRADGNPVATITADTGNTVSC